MVRVRKGNYLYIYTLLVVVVILNVSEFLHVFKINKPIELLYGMVIDYDRWF